MNEQNDIEQVGDQKCPRCYKKDWCMLSPCQAEECLGPFKNEGDNAKKFQQFCEAEESKPEARINRAVHEAMTDIYRRNRKLFDGRRGKHECSE